MWILELDPEGLVNNLINVTTNITDFKPLLLLPNVLTLFMLQQAKAVVSALIQPLVLLNISIYVYVSSYFKSSIL